MALLLATAGKSVTDIGECLFIFLVADTCLKVGAISKTGVAEKENACYKAGSPYSTQVCTVSYNFCSYYEQCL